MKDLLDRLSCDTHNRLQAAALFSCSQSEETITDIVLLDIAKDLRTAVVAEKTNKRQESDSGVDWEWWIKAGARPWLRMAIQAKKLSERGEYPRIHHANNNGLQIDMLARYARRNRVRAFYCFYNYFPEEPTRARHWRCCDPSGGLDLLGCSITPIATVRRLTRGGRMLTFDAVHAARTTLPWGCVLCHVGRYRMRLLVEPNPPELPSGQRVQEKESLRLSVSVTKRNAGPDSKGEANRSGLYTQLPPLLAEWLSARKTKSFRVSELPRDYYDPAAGTPRRIAILDVDEPESNSIAPEA